MINSELCIAVEVLLYAPTRPIIDYSVGFLWLMSVGTVICASLWSDITAPDDERNELSHKVLPRNHISILKSNLYLNVFLCTFHVVWTD